MSEKNLIVVSDSTGETADQVLHAAMVQFDCENIDIKRYSNISNLEKVDQIFEELTGENLIFATIVNPDIMDYLAKKSRENNYEFIDLLDLPLQYVKQFLKQEPKRKIGLTRQLSEHYFGKIEALEFAVKYDDCKDPRGIKKADIVLLGVSRTSKTPVSLNLAFKNFKVCNIPLVPEIEPPKEIYEVDSQKVIGLIINPDKLNKIREERTILMGLSVSDSEYSDTERINKELEYAKNILNKIGCKIIDVSNKTIEETSTEISNYIYRNNLI